MIKIFARLLNVTLIATAMVMPSVGSAQQNYFTSISAARFDLPVAENQIKLVEWNVENFFNSVHNPGKEDWEFLAKNDPDKNNCRKIAPAYRKRCLSTNWTQQGVAMKLAQVSAVIKAQGALPDILALEEVESEDIVQMIAKNFGYKYVFFDGDDERGIDNALLYSPRQLTLINADAINMSKVLGEPSRSMLRAHFNVNKNDKSTVLAIYVNHWPSQSNPIAQRMAYAQVLQQEITKGIEFYGAEHFNAVAVGDFNVPETERPSPVGDVLMNKSWPYAMYDAHQMSDVSQNPMNGKMPPGNYLFRGNYNRLDKILVTRNLKDNKAIEILPETFRVFAPPFMVRTDSQSGRAAPIRSNHNATDISQAGFSDHWPISVLFRIY